MPDSAAIGRKVVYDVRVKNNRAVSDKQVVVIVNVPPGMTPMTIGALPSQVSIVGQVVRFTPIAEIRAGEEIPFTIPVRADRAGKAQLSIQVTSQTEPRPIVVNEETNIYDDRPQ